MNLDSTSSSGDMHLHGTLVTSGGVGVPGGGNAGAINLISDNRIYQPGTIRALGGNGSDPVGGVTGGTGGNLTFNADGGVFASGLIETKGGNAVTTGVIATGGNGGAINIPATAAVHLFGLIDTSGGDLRLECNAYDYGTMTVRGTITARGGKSASNVGGDGGDVRIDTNGYPGGIQSDAVIDVSSGTGATGVLAAGNVTLDTESGDIDLLPGSLIIADGGAATGAVVAGFGGFITLETLGDTGSQIRIRGTIRARGGNSPAGTGGDGGSLTATTDNGRITVEAGAFIDMSGGSGATGGNARSDGTPASCAGALAVNFDSDQGGGQAAIINNGSIVANAGAVGNTNGGDIVFDGTNDDGTAVPASGAQSRSANGTGVAGDFCPF